MEEITKSTAKMWGPAIIGFGDKVLKYPNGRELDWFKIGFSPRKANFAFYIRKYNGIVVFRKSNIP